MATGDIALIVTALTASGALVTGIAAWVKARAERTVPTRTVAVAEVEVALRTLGETIDRLEAENLRMHGENNRLQVLVSQLRAEVERLRRLVEPEQ